MPRIIGVLQALPDPLPSDPLYGTIATLAPLPELRREEDVAEVVVAQHWWLTRVAKEWGGT